MFDAVNMANGDTIKVSLLYRVENNTERSIRDLDSEFNGTEATL